MTVDDGPGIYEILNQYSGDWYIGSSKHVMRRLEEHFRQLKAGKHPNKKMQKAYDRNGKHFVCFILQTLQSDDPEQMHIEEGKEILHHLKTGGHTYNNTLGGLMSLADKERYEFLIRRNQPIV